MTFLAELQRRRVFKVAAAYIVVAWIAVQVASIVFPAFDAPAWALRVFILIMLLGFPIALVMAWAYDVTPEGLKTEPGSSKYMYAVPGLLAVVALGWYFLASSSRHSTAVVGAAASGASATAASAVGTGSAPATFPAQPAPEKSIAVLPFADLSPAHDQEYFSDGMAEELRYALSRVADLKVAGRSSSFHYKGRNEDLRLVGQTLGVAHILEGSVRKQGDKIRITVDLIKAEDGFPLWSEAYDGDLSNVFEVQEHIARAITAQLSVLLQGARQRLVPVATNNPAAYALYLQATAVYNRRDGARIKEAIANLEQALQLDPGFARAYARLAALHVLAPSYTSVALDESLAAAERAANMAIELDPTLAEPHAVLASIYDSQRRFIDQRKEFERALEVEPEDVTANFWFASCLINTGYRRLGIAMLDHVLALDPMLSIALNWRANEYFDDGDLDHAAPLYQRAADLGLSFAVGGLGRLSRARGNTSLADEQTVAGLRALMPGFAENEVRAIVTGIHGDAAAHAKGMAVIDDYLATEPAVIDGVVLWMLIRLGEPGRALRLGEVKPTSHETAFFHAVMSHENRAIRRLPEFRQFTRATGLADLWEANGAPDDCTRVAKEEFDCE